MSDRLDAVVVGAGPNGLAAAISIAAAGRSVRLLEAAQAIGGGTRTEALTLPGFRHDVCSSVHPTALASPFFRSLPLERHGLRWLHAPAALAHPFDDGPAAILEEDLAATAAGLGIDGRAWRSLFRPLVNRADRLARGVLGPLVPPREIAAMARFAPLAVRSAIGMTRRFQQEGPGALIAGSSAHTAMPLGQPPTAAYGLFLVTLAQAHGWPVAAGGSASIAAALAAHLTELGGEIEVDRAVRSVRDLPPARAVLFDLTPRQLVAIGGPYLRGLYRRRLEGYRYGPGVFKLDWALDGPVPWQDPAAGRAATVHLAGSLAELRAAVRAPSQGKVAERPFVVFVQSSVADPGRAPDGQATAWAYCHVPNGSRVDMTGAIEAQVERFAPGFRDRVLARHAMGPAALEAHDANEVGGDINGGLLDWRQLFTRPVAAPVPYRMPAHPPDGAGWYVCSSSTPPGGGVHGMSGWWAARAALGRELA